MHKGNYLENLKEIVRWFSCKKKKSMSGYMHCWNITLRIFQLSYRNGIRWTKETSDSQDFLPCLFCRSYHMVKLKKYACKWSEVFNFDFFQRINSLMSVFSTVHSHHTHHKPPASHRKVEKFGAEPNLKIFEEDVEEKSVPSGAILSLTLGEFLYNKIFGDRHKNSSKNIYYILLYRLTCV